MEGVSGERGAHATSGYAPVGHAEHLHDARQLLLLVLAREQRVARVQLGNDAAETPNVDGRVVVHAEDDLCGGL